MPYYNQLSQKKADLQALCTPNNEKSFFAQEAIRFLSITGTLKYTDFKLDETASQDERYITHPLIRSLLENFFSIVYIFDDPANSSERYSKVVLNGFKMDYLKLENEFKGPSIATAGQHFLSNMEPADQNWKQLSVLKVRDQLTAVKNVHGDRLDYLYFTYRIASFDTHGRSLSTIFANIFGKQCGFSVLNVERVIELIASEYLEVFSKL